MDTVRFTVGAGVLLAILLLSRRRWGFRNLPPLVVVIRTARPTAVVLGFIILISRRLFLYQKDPVSLLDHLVTCLDYLQQLTAEHLYPPLHFFIFRLWILLEDFMVILLMASLWRIAYRLAHYSRDEWQDLLVDSIFTWAKQHIPLVQQSLDKECAKLQKDVNQSLGKNNPDRAAPLLQLPEEGRPPAQLLEQLQESGQADNAHWMEGKVSGAVYTTHNPEHMALMAAAYQAYSFSNPLHAEIWPSLRQMEAEIVSMTAHLLHGTASTVGTTTSGGTESIILSIKAHAVHYGKLRGISTPEVICGHTCHASVDKACDLLGLRKVCVQVNPATHTLEPRDVQHHITANTILIYASAPNFPQGVIDPIEALSELALRYNVGLHVDACLGGFVLPFAQQLGYDIPKFDFACPGVTAMSADTHKFAYASKGTSVVLYRNAHLRHAQYFAYAKWSGGLYATPTLAGSRPGGLLACAWATLVSTGNAGYQRHVRSIMEASRTIAEGIANIPGIKVLGSQQTHTMVVCFASDEVDIYRVGDYMKKHGWHLNPLQHPASLHICVTLNTVPLVYKFIEELRESVAAARKEGAGASKKGTAGVYGMSGSMPAGPVNEILNAYLDMMYDP